MNILIKGTHNSGKTTLIEKLIKKFVQNKIVVIKLSDKQSIDVQGKDSLRYREVGSFASIFLARKETAIFRGPSSLEQAIVIAKKLLPDIIICEGNAIQSDKFDFIIDMAEHINFNDVCENIHTKLLQQNFRIMIQGDGKIIPLNSFVEELYYNTLKTMLQSLKTGDTKQYDILINV